MQKCPVDGGTQPVVNSCVAPGLMSWVSKPRKTSGAPPMLKFLAKKLTRTCGARTLPLLRTLATTVLLLPTHGTFAHCGSAAFLALRTSMSGDCHGRCGEAGHGL